MKKNWPKFTFLLVMIFSLQGFTPVMAEIFELKSGKIELTVPANWQKSLNFLENPLTLFGPVFPEQAKEKKPKRAAWIFSDAHKGNEKLNNKELEKKQDHYFSGRLKWMARRQATLVDKISYNVFQNKTRIKFHQIGIVYRLSGKVYTEESLFFICKDSLINITRLTPENEKERLKADYKKLIDSISCLP